MISRRLPLKAALFFMTSLVFFALPLRLSPQESKAEWLKKFKHARYVAFSWGGSIERYQLSLLTDSLKGEMVDDMINWRQKARTAVANLKGCHTQYQSACGLLEEIIVLLGNQESICTGKEYVMAHLDEWRENKKKIKQLHKELNGVLKL